MPPVIRSIVDKARDEQTEADEEERERKRQEAMARRNVAERRDQPRRPEPPDERRERIAQDVLRIRGKTGPERFLEGAQKAMGVPLAYAGAMATRAERAAEQQAQAVGLGQRGLAAVSKATEAVRGVQAAGPWVRSPRPGEQISLREPAETTGLGAPLGRVAGAVAESPPVRALGYSYEKTREFLGASFEPLRQLMLAFASPGLTTDEKRAILKAVTESPLLKPFVGEEARERLADVEKLEPEGKLENLLSGLHGAGVEMGTVIVEPLNLVPILGFTRIEDFTRALNALSKAAKNPAVRRMADGLLAAVVKGEKGFAKVPGTRFETLPPRGGKGFPDAFETWAIAAPKPEPVLGMLSDFTPTRKLPKWLEDPYIRAMETFTRPTELDLPATLIPLGRVQRRLTTMGDYYEQIAVRNLRATEAKERLTQVRAAYESQAHRRRITAKAQRLGLTETPEGLYSKNEIVAAQKAARQAKRELRQALDALKEADVRRVGDDVVEEALALGAPDTEAAVLRQFFENASRFEQMDEPFLNLPSWRKRLDAQFAKVQGNVPGIVGEMGQDMMAYRAALEETRRPFVQLLDDTQALIEKELPKLEFIGKEEYIGLADRYGAYYLVTHPEDFKGISPALKGLLDEVEEMAGARYATLRAIDPRAAPEIAQRYLPQLWDDGIEFMERVRRPAGRPGPTKPRAIKDWRPLALSDEWPRELTEMSPAELLDYSSRASDQALADRAFRKIVLDHYGTKIKPKAAAGLVRFNNPVFSGWWGPPDVRWMIDAIYEPGPQWTRTLSPIGGPIKNSVFGPDISVAGYNVLQAMAVGAPLGIAGAFNRMLRMMGTGVDYWGARGLTRRLAFTVDGLPAAGVESAYSPGRGTWLKWVPGISRADPAIGKALDKWQHVQFGIVMASIRDLVAEGGLLLAKATGQNIDDIAVRRPIMDAAAAITGSGRGALRAGRREIEAEIFASSRITRSLFAMVGTAANLARPGASPMQRIMAASVIGNFAITLSAVGWAINKYFGDGLPYNPLPFEWEDGKVKRNRDWATTVIKGRRYSLVPQKALMVLMWKSMEAIMELDPDALARSNAQFGFSRLHPVLQPVGLAFGFGYVPHSGFWTGGISSKDRVKLMVQGSVFPIIAQVALQGEEQGFRGFTEEIFGLNSYELSVSDKIDQFLGSVGPTLSEEDQEALALDVIPKSVRQMPEYQALENERLQDMLNNPRTRDYAVAKQTRDENIAAAGEKFAGDKDGWAYRSTIHDERFKFIIRIEDMEFENKGLISEYREAAYGPDSMDEAGNLDYDLVDANIAAWEDQATPEEYRAVREFERSVNDPWEAEFRLARQRKRDSGYDDIPEDAWESVAPMLLGATAEGYKNLRDYKEYLRQQILPTIPSNLEPGLRVAMLEVTVDADPVVKAVSAAETNLRRLMLDSNPWLLDLILQFGWKSPGKHDIGVLTGGGAE